MELIIVLAVLAIIAAILIPTFLNTTDRARLRSDIQSAQVIHNAMELFRAERGAVAGGNGADMDAILSALHTAGYLRFMTAKGTQTVGAEWVLHDGRVAVKLPNNPSTGIANAANSLTVNERRYITNFTFQE